MSRAAMDFPMHAELSSQDFPFYPWEDPLDRRVSSRAMARHQRSRARSLCTILPPDGAYASTTPVLINTVDVLKALALIALLRIMHGLSGLFDFLGLIPIGTEFTSIASYKPLEPPSLNPPWHVTGNYCKKEQRAFHCDLRGKGCLVQETRSLRATFVPHMWIM
ncbi:hypothetical protein PG984_003541 [Apiospora sp. TS-2023a]